MVHCLWCLKNKNKHKTEGLSLPSLQNLLRYDQKNTSGILTWKGQQLHLNQLKNWPNPHAKHVYFMQLYAHPQHREGWWKTSVHTSLFWHMYEGIWHRVPLHIFTGLEWAVQKVVETLSLEVLQMCRPGTKRHISEGLSSQADSWTWWSQRFSSSLHNSTIIRKVTVDVRSAAPTKFYRTKRACL